MFSAFIIVNGAQFIFILQPSRYNYAAATALTVITIMDVANDTIMMPRSHTRGSDRTNCSATTEIMDDAASIAATVAPHRQPRQGDGDEDEGVSNDDDASVATNAHRT